MNTPDGVDDAMQSYLDAIDKVVADNVTDDDIEARLRRLKGRPVSCRRHSDPVPAAPGLLICADCRDKVEEALIQLPELFDLFAHLPPSAEVVSARSETLGMLASWCGLVTSKRGVAGPDEMNVRKLVVFLAQHLGWLYQHPSAPDLVDELLDVATALDEVISSPGGVRQREEARDRPSTSAETTE